MGGDGKYICAKDNNKNVYIFNVKIQKSIS